MDFKDQPDQQSTDELDLLLPSIIDARARSKPETIFCAFLEVTNAKDGLTVASYGNFANAVNKCAWWIEETIRLGDGSEIKTLGYLGPPDIRHVFSELTLLEDAVAVDSELYSWSPCFARNDHCDILLTASDSPELRPTVSSLLSERKLQAFTLENIGHWIGQAKSPEYPFLATLRNDASRPFVILQTSGSTERWISMRRSLQRLLANDPIFGPSSLLPSPKLAAEIHQLTLCKSAILPVSVLEPLSWVPEYLEGLRKLELVIWCGSAFSFLVVPETIRALVPINACYGATELSPFITQVES
ncbi:hypothetical protein G7Y89_g15357 [Cudoniella acicularis]|uniref:Uncharacterized protein n=1 Tax=Cudoniella acicularis TaxID=354080 RepID=A0A8H4QPF9_9HELO|nr:hypothetical protein G7Y89_g15357 [Cudoniella acicularis]